MSEQRLIDVSEMYTDGKNCFKKNLDYCDHFDLDEWLNEQPTINPETLPIVRELLAKLGNKEDEVRYWKNRAKELGEEKNPHIKIQYNCREYTIKELCDELQFAEEKLAECEPVVHAHWEWFQNPETPDTRTLRCSHCHCGKHVSDEHPMCPWCGAIMDEEAD